MHIWLDGSVSKARAHQALESGHGKAQSSALATGRSHGIIPDDNLLEMSVLLVEQGFL